MINDAQPDHGTPIRYAMKRKSYRGKDGWLVYVNAKHKCDRPLCFTRVGTRLFVESESEARRMRDELRRGLSPMFDYQLRELIATGHRESLSYLGYDLPPLR